MKLYTPIKLFLLLLMLFSAGSLLAQVNITQPTGGQNISNDLSTLGTTPGYTTIGDIVIAETAPGDFATGSNRTLTFDRPSTAWQFSIGQGIATGNGNNISNVSITSVTAGRITVRYTITGASDGSNSITISGIQVQSTTKTLGSEVFIFNSTTGNGVVNGLVEGNATTGTKVAPLSKKAGDAAQLLALMPGQSLSPGSTTGKTGTATTPTAGTPFNVKVYSTDYAWNPTVSSDEINITSNDTYAVLPLNDNLDGTNGGSDFSVTLRLAVISPAVASQTITATNVTDPGIEASTTTAVRVNRGPFAKLLMLFPGETLEPGSPTGKTGDPDAPMAGVNYTTIIYSVDNCWNRVSSTNNIGVSATGVTNFTPPANGNMSGGVRTVQLVFKVPGETPNVTAINNTDGTKSPYNQVLPAVVLGPFTKLLVLLPGETIEPGTSTGKGGSPTPRIAGTSFVVTVHAVDGAWNPVPGVTDIIHLATNDVNAVMPSDMAMIDGVASFTTTTLVTAGSNRTITASNVTDEDKTANTSSNVTVQAGEFTKLQLLLPGETAAPGTPTGKTGTPTDVTAGVAIIATVRAVDAHWNLVNNPYPTDQIEVISSDTNGVNPAAAALSSGVRTRSVTLNTIGTATITANNVTDNSITSDTSPSVNVISSGYAKLQILLPGETAAPGTPTGKTGSPTLQTAGATFTVTVNAVDAAWNPITDITDVIELTSSDVNATMPTNLAMVNGVATFTTTALVTAGSNRTITATNVTDNTKTANTSAGVTIQAGAYARLVVLMPNQTLAPGTPTGISGNPVIPDRGTQFQIRTRGVDAYFNTVTDNVSSHILSFSSPGNIMPGSVAMVTNGYRTSNVNIILTGPQNVTVTDGTTDFNVTITVPEPNPASLITDHFRSLASGLWTNSANWESSTDGSTNWHPATLTPTSGSATITVINGHTLTITATISLDQVTIQNGAKIDHQGGTLTIADGADVIDFQVDGVLSSRGTITKTGALHVGATGRYQHAHTTATGIIPAAVWETGSVCEIIGYTSYVSAITGSNQSFSTFEWNAVDQNVSDSGPILSSGFSADNFIVTSTGSGVVHLGTTGGTINIGNYTQTSGKVIINRTSGTLNLNIGGDFSIANANFEKGSGASTIYFNGVGNQSLSAVNVNSGNGLSFWNVNFANGATKTLSSGSFSLATTGILAMGANTTLNANGNLTVLSNALSSGRVAAIPSDSQITGNVTVQRFITGGAINPYRTYRILSSPIHTGGNTYSFTQFIDDILITGAAANGFDQPKANPTSTTAWTYNGTTLVPIPNINTSILAGQGAFLMFMGDRSNALAKVTSPFVNPESVVIDFEGILNQQNVTVPLISSAMNMLGNPYASTIDWNTITSGQKADLSDNVISTWNPATRQYATFNGTVGANGGSRYITAGQGFFVNAKAGGGSFLFTENDKVANMAPTLLMSTPVVGNDLNLVGTANKIMTASNKATSTVTTETIMAANNAYNVQATLDTELRVWLKKESIPYEIETVVIFKNGASSNYVKGEDAMYTPGLDLYMSSLSEDNGKLVINYMPAVGEDSKVKLDLPAANTTGNYALLLNYTNLPSGYLVKVNDNFTGTSQVLQNGESYAFAIDKTQADSYGTDRLSVSFEPPTTLPVELSSFSATKVNEGVLVKWSTLAEINNDRFEIERAGDDKAFIKLHIETAKGSGSNYSFVDRSPLLGNNYYRLVQFDKNNTANVSELLLVNYTGQVGGTIDAVNIYPNPVVANFTVKYNGTLKTNQQSIRIIDAAGKVLFTKTVAKQELTQGCEFNMASYATGMYVVEIYENGNQKVGQTKLIKQ